MRQRLPGAAGVFLAFTALGLWNMAPSVSFGDSGEFIASAATLSVAHAPGYPLFCLTAKALGTLLPMAPWAYRVNLLSVLCGALALALLWRALRDADVHPLGAAAGVLFLGLSPLWLHTSLQTEVFALNSLFAAACVRLFAAYADDLFRPRPMAALGLFLGLGGANHHTLIFVVPSLAASALLRLRERGKRISPASAARAAAWFLSFGLLGLGAYLYLPIRAGMNPPLDWGHPVDIPRFLHVLLRRDYGSFALTIEGAAGSRFAAVLPQTLRYARALLSGFGPVGLLLAAFGLAAFHLRRPEAGKVPWHFPVLLLVFSGPVFLWLGNPPFDAQTGGALQRFFLMSWLGAAWLTAAGAAWLRSQGRWGRTAAAALLLAPLAGALRASDAWAQRWDLAAEDYGRNVLRSLPPGALFFMDGGDDTFYTLAYLLYTRGLRPDIEPHDRGGLVFPSLYGPDFRRLTKEGKEKRRVRVEAAAARGRPTFYSTLNSDILPGRMLPLHGLFRRVGAPTQQRPVMPVEDSEGRALWEAYPQRTQRRSAASHYRYRALIPVYPVMRAAAATARGDLTGALLRLRIAAEMASDVRWVPSTVSNSAQWVGFQASAAQDWKTAQAAYTLASRLEPDRPSLWTNLGVTLEKQDRLQEAEAVYRRGLALDPKSAQAYYNLGTLYWKLGRWAESASMFQQAVEVDPQNSAARAFALRAAQRASVEVAP